MSVSPHQALTLSPTITLTITQTSPVILTPKLTPYLCDRIHTFGRIFAL